MKIWTLPTPPQKKEKNLDPLQKKKFARQKKYIDHKKKEKEKEKKKLICNPFTKKALKKLTTKNKTLKEEEKKCVSPSKNFFFDPVLKN